MSARVSQNRATTSMGVNAMPFATASRKRQISLLSKSLYHPLDRVNVLGDSNSGHTGCVNALSWANNGELLLSGGDDTTVRVWRIDPGNPTKDYPFVCDAVIHTGHHANIFNAQMLPNSTRIATAAGDRQVRISDIGSATGHSAHGQETEYSSRQANVRIIRCHSGRVKRIVTEESPDLFLTVAEDGTVRQHDLRVPHGCHTGSCPAPLIKVEHELTALAMSPLAPYHLVTAGESPYGYLFDRRQVGRLLQEEWGVPLDSHNVTTCVRRFGRASYVPNERSGPEHITGARMASSNGHEVLLSYNADAVYLYSTKDETQSATQTSTSVLPPNAEANARPMTRIRPDTETTSHLDIRDYLDTAMEEDIERFRLQEDAGTEHSDPMETDETARFEDEEHEEYEERAERILMETVLPSVPIIPPRARFTGLCNVETVKDVNFLGPQDDFVTSGSDDGNFFIWNKSTGRMHDILEGDSSVVNVIEGHPYLPLVAVSGIDTTVKLFAPAHGRSAFSRMANSEGIIRRNSEASSRRLSRRLEVTGLLMQAALARQLALAEDQPADVGDVTGTQCNYQ